MVHFKKFGLVSKVTFNAFQVLSGIFRDCLNKAEDSGLTSISFPSIGTGKLGFPKKPAAQTLFDEISTFSSKRQTKSLAEVTIILYSGDTETQQVKRMHLCSMLHALNH